MFRKLDVRRKSIVTLALSPDRLIIRYIVNRAAELKVEFAATNLQCRGNYSDNKIIGIICYRGLVCKYRHNYNRRQARETGKNMCRAYSLPNVYVGPMAVKSTREDKIWKHAADAVYTLIAAANQQMAMRYFYTANNAVPRLLKTERSKHRKKQNVDCGRHEANACNLT